MLSKYGQSVRVSDTRHKYDSAMAEWLDTVVGWDMSDEDGGSVESPIGCWARFGRRVLRGDEQGFVSCETYPTADDATAVCKALSLADETWEFGPYDERSEMTDEAREVMIEQTQRFAQYVISCAEMGLVAFSWDAWRRQGEPRYVLGGE